MPFLLLYTLTEEILLCYNECIRIFLFSQKGMNPMSKVSVSFDIDSELKSKGEAILKTFGLDLPSAVELLLQQLTTNKNLQNLPFGLKFEDDGAPSASSAEAPAIDAATLAKAAEGLGSLLKGMK